MLFGEDSIDAAGELAVYELCTHTHTHTRGFKKYSIYNLRCIPEALYFRGIKSAYDYINSPIIILLLLCINILQSFAMSCTGFN